MIFRSLGKTQFGPTIVSPNGRSGRHIPQPLPIWTYYSKCKWSFFETTKNHKWTYVSYGNGVFWAFLEPVFVDFIRKSHHSRNRVWVGIYFDSNTVSRVVWFLYRLHGNWPQKCPKVIISIWNISPFMILWPPNMWPRPARNRLAGFQN